MDRRAISPGELRENIVVAGIDSTVFKPGATVAFSSGAEVRLTFYCEPFTRFAHLVDSLDSIARKRGILGAERIEVIERSYGDRNFYSVSLKDYAWQNCSIC